MILSWIFTGVPFLTAACVHRVVAHTWRAGWEWPCGGTQHIPPDEQGERRWGLVTGGVGQRHPTTISQHVPVRSSLRQRQPSASSSSYDGDV